MTTTTTRTLRRVLIANRGEIAIRVARAAGGLGIETVGVRAPVDSASLHAQYTDRTVEIRGEGAAADSVDAYLDIEALIRTALEAGCDSIHPGYGFLSENTAFATRCQESGLAFIGPPPEVLSLFGDKAGARRFASELGIPVVPGSPGTVDSSAGAAAIADKLGYPVMLKAAAGGGGRGMRLVNAAAEMPEAFERCASEARASFGDGALFVEKLVARPRHIEVQILADRVGNIAHLFERDCSVQLRNQKVVEVAPAPNLDPELRRRLLASALELARAAGYVNAGTVEFLVSPESGEYFFIECNPRVQVEHTVTEQVTGIDIVEAQFRLAGGASLADLGLAGENPVDEPRTFAVQARVVARGHGTITSYREPAGPGVRVDGAGYAGYSPPPQFDPLLAKVVCTANSTGTFESAVNRTLAALREFHVGGLPTNVAQLTAILQHPEFRTGNARTTLLTEHRDILSEVASNGSGPAEFLSRQASLFGVASTPPLLPGAGGGLEAGEGQLGVECPITGSLVAFNAGEGEEIGAGDALVTVSAMKMETVVPSPVTGRVEALAELNPGDAVSVGQFLAVMRPTAGAEGPAAASAALPAEETWQPLLDEVATLQGLAAARFAPGSQDPGVVRQRSRGKLTCRERIALLLDDGSFREVGSIAGFASYDEDGYIAEFTPANHVGGWGRIDGRTAVVCADDFTSRGGHADGAIGAKSGYLDRLSLELRAPSVRMLDGSSGGGSVAAMVPAQKQEGESRAKESSGAIKAGRPRVAGTGGSFLPGHLGSSMFTEQLATVPVVNMLLGSVVGIGAAKAVLGHFSVMVRDIAQLFVAGPPVVAHAMGYDISKEDLGGWQVHCLNGSVDNLAESEEEAVAMAKRFLSYVPSSVYEAPPITVLGSDDAPDRRDDELFTIIPRKRTTTFDIRKVIRLLADRDSFFEIGPLWGTDQVTGFVRFKGYPMGVIASDSRHANGGALTADGCDKLIRHLDICDTFHLPVLNLVDNPGFAVGLEHERASAVRRGGAWMVAFSQVSVPIFTVLMRRSFGVAGNNYATPQSHPSVRVTWPAADVGGIPPEGGIEAAYRRQLAEADDPEALRAELYERIESARGPLGPTSRFQIEEIIDPRDTRRLICEWVENAFRIATRPDRLGPRSLQFRP